MAEEDVQTTLTTLTSQLDTLEESLKPLLASNYQDLVSAQQSPLIKAKLNVLLSYAVHDLIWVYLKTAGVNPATHPVMPEIERLKTYFAKLKSAETGQPIPSATPITTQRRMQIDKQAASRFITHAINSQKSRIDPDYQAPEGAEGEGGEEFEMEGGKHTRFDLGEEENEEVERLLDDELEESDDEVDVQEVVKKGKGKEKEKEVKKVGRKILDPFAGYDQPTPSPSTASKPKSAPSSAEKRKRSEVEDSPATPSSATAGDASASASQKKKKKDGKKLKIKK
ncbi:hypothetical protein JCM5353_002594 [Sporobolomyces roseus]